ncbi:hypothetical protein [uncultured Sphingobium sp.]|uniref:hypothetical protein n=1 Tax=uncultured Sphingobium sp. TaxID=316087 RepID=UPI00259B85A4|nr:hypothetical protein [uncultured Sphingobium sp.]
MQTYEVKTPLRGFRRADRDSAPISVGQVVILPSTKATTDLLDLEAIVPTDAEETCPIDHVSFLVQSSGQVANALSSALFPPIAVVAVTDRYALVGAIEDLGGVVFFVGEGLPDNAEQVLGDFPNEQLLAELDIRRAEGRLAVPIAAPVPDAVPPIIAPAPVATPPRKPKAAAK